MGHPWHRNCGGLLIVKVARLRTVLSVEDDEMIGDVLLHAINEEQGYRARGIATYLKKPFDLEELLHFVKRSLPPLSGSGRTA